MLDKPRLANLAPSPYRDEPPAAGVRSAAAFVPEEHKLPLPAEERRTVNRHVYSIQRSIIL